MTESEAIKDNCDRKCTNCSNTELPNIKDCKEMDIGYYYSYKTDCAGDRYIKAEEVKYLLKLERDKAIDDFVEELKRKTPMENMLIDELAEQLKEKNKL